MRISDWSSDVCSSDLPGKAPAQGELPLPITEKNQAADSITIAAKSAYASILPNMRRHSGKSSAIVFALPPPLPPAPERMAETGSTIGLPQVQAQTRPQPQPSAGSDLAERGYQRLPAGERKPARKSGMEGKEG